MKPRHEYKIQLHYADYVMLRNRLRKMLTPDAHADKNGEYSVRSLYFDTPRDAALREKIDGVNHRDKFRIRIYNCDPSFIQLEKKSKHNGLCYKQSEIISQAQARSIIDGDIGWLRESESPLFVDLYSRMLGQVLRPKTVVDYIREPFCYAPGNVRITLDRCIRSGLYSTDLFNPEIPVVQAEPRLIILEVKYDEFLPSHIQRIVQMDSRNASACSKYALCRIYG